MGKLSCVAALLVPALGQAQFLVEPVYETTAFAGADVDSVAVWVAPDPAASLLFVTEKALDRVEVWYAATGRPYDPLPFLGGEPDSSEPGQFNRPNAVCVIYRFPFRDELCDLLLVTEQLNSRVQIFRLPELTYFGDFANGDLSTYRYYGRGLAAYRDGDDHYVFVTDSSPSRKVKKYRLVEAGERLGAELVAQFGEESGAGALDIVESVLADPAHDRLHVCGDEGGDDIHIFNLAGEYAGVTYGEPCFEFDPEGIVLWDTGEGQGYIVISDQYTNGEPNEFEVFDRATLEHLGHFESPGDGQLVTTNTDGIFLLQHPLPGFPDGAFFAVNDDANVHAYDWMEVALAMGLEIGTPDRRFRRGDANADGGMDVSDAVFLLLHLFAGGRGAPCAKAADADDSGALDVTDAVYLLEALFRADRPPPPPFATCGADPTPDGLTCDSYPCD
jgi:3-phytase